LQIDKGLKDLSFDKYWKNFDKQNFSIFLGMSDQVKCFYCDGGLKNWQPEDDPWVEHAR
jgi:hypothetical protein